MTAPVIPVTGKTPVYSIEYLLEGEPAYYFRAKLQRNSDRLEALLQARGIAPLEAQQALALSGQVNANSDRVTALEGKLTTAWVDLTPVAASYTAYTVGGYATPAYRVEDRRVYLRGWVRAAAAVAASAPIFTAAVAASARPAFKVDLKARDNSTGAQRVSIGADGVIYSELALASGAYVALDGVSWPLG